MVLRWSKVHKDRYRFARLIRTAKYAARRGQCDRAVRTLQWAVHVDAKLGYTHEKTLQIIRGEIRKCRDRKKD